MSVQPITIVGAGLAGLTLGRSLRKHDIPAVILERASSPPRSNYGITLHSSTYRPLLSLLQSDEPSFRAKVAVDSAHGGAGALSSSSLAPGVVANPGSFRCHRGRLEAWLREGQNILWSHEVESFQTSAQKITLAVKDKKPTETKVLIGTDGVHSRIRKSLPSDVTLKVLPFVVFNGKRSMSILEYNDVVALALQNQTVIQSRHEDVLLEISINNFTPEAVELNYTYSRPARQNDQLHNPNRSVSGAADIPEEFFIELAQLRGLPKPFDALFDAAKVRQDRLLHWLMRVSSGTYDQMRSLADRGVLLLGDAIHAMPILGGEGANTAIKDGLDLAEHISSHGTESLREFLDFKSQVWKRGVEESEQRIAEMLKPARAAL